MDDTQRWQIIWTDERKAILVDGKDISETVESFSVSAYTPNDLMVELRLIGGAAELEMQVDGKVVKYHRS